jgi:hypothetical protein
MPHCFAWPVCPQPSKWDKVYRLDTSKDVPPDWLAPEQYEAVRSDPELEAVRCWAGMNDAFPGG